MPVSYQSWEMASGPTVAYKMAGRSNGCAITDSSKGANFSNFRVQDSISRSLGEAPKSSNYRLFSPQDGVMWGMSALSLRGQSKSETEASSEESRSASLGALCRGPPEPHRCLSPKSSESSRAPLTSVYHTSMPTGFDYLKDRYMRDGLHSFSNMFRSSISSPLSTGMGTSNLELLDTISESSISSGNDMPLASSTSSSGETSQLSDDTEAQSAYKEPPELSSSVGASSLPRKGLSKFYAGKSRSFSCLSDVVSVKDLSKSESPYVKKRRSSLSSSSGLPPLQKGAASISKKPLHSSKCTLALAVAMNKEEYEAQTSAHRPPMCQTSTVPSRSFSLSDLQRAATGSLFFIG